MSAKSYLSGTRDPDDALSEAKAEIARLRAALDRSINRDKVWALFVDHYWDTFQRDRDLILSHINSVLIATPPVLSDEQSTVEERKEHCFGAFSKPPR
jgi:hypothetical protein